MKIINMESLWLQGINMSDIYARHFHCLYILKYALYDELGWSLRRMLGWK
jgi:hypothetical protein